MFKINLKPIAKNLLI